MVLDNLREGVIVADIYDPTLNPLFRRCARPLRVVAIPCQGLKIPIEKEKWKRVSDTHRRLSLKGLRFESLARSAGLSGIAAKNAGQIRVFMSTHAKRQVAAMFNEEKPSLLPLPLEPFRYYQYGETRRTSGWLRGGRSSACYGLPPGWIGRSVKVQWDALHVRILHPSTNQLLREHLRQKRGWYRSPRAKTTQKMPFSTAQLLRRAGHARKPRSAYCVWPSISAKVRWTIRRILGILSLPGNSVRRLWKTPVPRPSRSVCRSIASCSRYLERRPQLTAPAGRSADP